MKRFLKYTLWILVVSFIGESCTTLRPVAASISEADYNQRVTVENPRFKRKHSAIGWAFDLGMPIAGGVAGYAYGPYVRQTPNGQVSFPVGNILLGTLVGTGFTYISHAVGNYGSIEDVKNEQKWVRKAFGNDYIILPPPDDNTLRIINAAAERGYTVKNIDDVKDFSIAFPNSLYAEKIVEQGLKNLKRKDLPDILQLYPQTAYAEDLKNRFIVESPTFQELEWALTKYPKPASDVEELFVKLVDTPSKAISFHQKYPNSTHNKAVICNAFQTASETDDVRKLLETFGKDFYLNQSEMANTSDSIRRNYFVGLRDLDNYKKMSQLDAFYEKYEWLTFPDKKHEIALKVWDLANQLYSQGKNVIAQAGKVVSKPYAQKEGLDATYFTEFAKEMLKKELSNITVVSTNAMSSTSEEFERWKNSAYAAGIVKNEGKLQFLVYGEVKNDTKFDLPLAMRVWSKIYQVQKIENGGLLGALVSMIGSFTDAATQVDLLGSVESKSFIIPCLLAGQTMPYAILIEFEDKDINGFSGGLNLMDLMKVSSNIVLGDTEIRLGMTDQSLTEERLAEQDAWLTMAMNGLPEARTIDFFRNQEYRQDTWDAEWEQILENVKNSPSSSSYSDSDNDAEDSYDDTEKDTEKDTKISGNEKMYTCSVRLYHNDGSPISCNTIRAEWDEGGGIFQNRGSGKFRVGDKGNVVISWPASEGDRVVYISFNESLLPDWDRLENLDIRPDTHHEINVDAIKNQ